MNVDLTPLVQGLAALLFAALSASIPIVLPAIMRRLHLSLSQDQSTALVDACGRGADLAYKFLIDNGATYNNVPIHNAAVATGVAYVVSHFPDTMKTLGLTPDHVESIVKAQLGARYVADQNLSIAAPKAPATP
jgi:hypothetical protein